MRTKKSQTAKTMPTSGQAKAKALDSEVLNSKPSTNRKSSSAKDAPRKDQVLSQADPKILSRRILLPVRDAVLAIVRSVTMPKKSAVMVILNRITFFR